MKYKKWGGFLLAAILAAVLPGYVNAATIDTQSTTIGANDDSPKVIIVSREVTGVKNYVDTYFKYSLVADANNPAVVDVSSIKDMTLYVSGAPDNANKVVGSMAINFSFFEFSELGDYKFILTEISSADADNYPVDSEHEYYIYVSVRNELVGGVPTGKMVATLQLQARNHDEGDKTPILFSSEAVRTRLELSKNVTGNLANTEEYFKFIVTINGREGDLYTLSGQDENIVYGGETITTNSVYTVGDEGVEVFLRHGQTVTIGLGADNLNEIPINVEYSIEEADADDYSTIVDGNDGKITGTKLASVLLPNNEVPTENQTNFVNHKESAVLTGITLAILPAAVLIVAMFAGAVVIRKMKKDSTNKR